MPKVTASERQEDGHTDLPGCGPLFTRRLIASSPTLLFALDLSQVTAPHLTLELAKLTSLWLNDAFHRPPVGERQLSVPDKGNKDV